MHYVYFLWSEKLQKIYIGESADIIARLQYHNSGRQRFTSRGIPWKPIACIPFASRAEALKEEKRLKKLRSRPYLKQYLLTQGRKFPFSGVSPDHIGI